MYRSIFISDIFRIINLLFTIALTIYLFKKYALNDLKTQMKDAGLELENLQQTIKDSKQKINSIDLEIDQQQKEYTLLLGKVKEWAHGVDRYNSQIEEELKQNLAKAKSRIDHQTKNLEAILVKQSVIPLAIKKIENEILQKFTEPASKIIFNKDIIKSVEGISE